MGGERIIDLYFARDEAAIRETDCKYGVACRRLSENITHDIRGLRILEKSAQK